MLQVSMFNSSFDAIFSQPRIGRVGTASQFFSNLSRSNPTFREFRRTPLGRAAVSSASLLGRLTFNSAGSASSASIFDGFFSDNSASSVGSFNSGSAAYGALDIATNLIGGLLSQALTRHKVTTTTRESDRSVQAQKLWNSSRSEQDAELARIVQRGLNQL